MEIPNGSIYKHLFEAQSQLAEKLESSSTKRKEQKLPKIPKQHSTVSSNLTIDTDVDNYKPSDADKVCMLDDDFDIPYSETESENGKNQLEILADKEVLKYG